MRKFRISCPISLYYYSPISVRGGSGSANFSPSILLCSNTYGKACSGRYGHLATAWTMNIFFAKKIADIVEEWLQPCKDLSCLKLFLQPGLCRTLY